MRVENRLTGSATIAVAPALNMSGSRDFDQNRFADLMAGELSFADNIQVIPVSRVLGVLAAQGRERIESPRHAGELADWLGADAILVFAVSEYDPYDPPRIGISAQLYATRPLRRVELNGELVLAELTDDDARLLENRGAYVFAETQRVFNAAYGDVAAEIQDYARTRSADQSPYGWRKYVVDQQGFIEFCCHATIRALLDGQRHERWAVGAQTER